MFRKLAIQVLAAQPCMPANKNAMHGVGQAFRNPLPCRRRPSNLPLRPSTARGRDIVITTSQHVIFAEASPMRLLCTLAAIHYFGCNQISAPGHLVLSIMSLSMACTLGWERLT
jgi:hypothetical protein